jgi:hypothetical protein
MPRYLITYDNHAPRDYTGVYRLMQTWNAVRLTKSLWLANLVGPAPVVRDLVQGVMQWNDTIAVIELQPGADWATSFVPPAAANWLSNNVTPAAA